MPYNNKNKRYTGTVVVTSDDAFVYNPITKRKNKLNPNYEFVGKIDTTVPGIVLKANEENRRTEYLDDVAALNKRTKCDAVDLLHDDKGKRNGRRVLYLVRTDPKSKTDKAELKKLKKTNKGGKS